MCSRGEAVFEVAETTGAAVVVITADVVGTVTVLVDPGLRDDSIFSTGGSGRGGGGGGEPGGVVLLAAVSAECRWYLGVFFSDGKVAVTLGYTEVSTSSCGSRVRFSSILSNSPAFAGRLTF